MHRPILQGEQEPRVWGELVAAAGLTVVFGQGGMNARVNGLGRAHPLSGN
jgi:hypothetical protein